MLQQLLRRRVAATALTLMLAGASTALGGTAAFASGPKLPAPTGSTASAVRHGESPTVAALRAKQRAQQVSVRPLAAGSGNIANYGASGKCIGISNGLAGDWNCTQNGDQRWHWANIGKDSNGIY